jgi:hypothetical protein
MIEVAVIAILYVIVFVCGLYIGREWYRRVLKRELRKAGEMGNDEHAHIDPNLVLRELRGRRAL